MARKPALNQSFHENRRYYRHGPDHRGGREVTFRDLKRDFGLYGLKIGSWVTGEEQRLAALRFHDALNDLMVILGGTPALISLRGTLSVHYGTGGQRGVAAHYEPGRRTLALAKNAGPGSIAHEWFHALDHHLGNKVFPEVSAWQLASTAWLNDATPTSHPLAGALLACFRTIMLDPTGTRPSDLFRASAEVDRATGQLYYSRPEEMSARAFEAFVQDADITNHFLVKGTKASPEAADGLYPGSEQRREISQAFRYYFNLLSVMLRKQGTNV